MFGSAETISGTKAFFDTSEKFEEIYFSLMKYLSANVFDFDFIFQGTPTIRFYFH